MTQECAPRASGLPNAHGPKRRVQGGKSKASPLFLAHIFLAKTYSKHPLL